MDRTESRKLDLVKHGSQCQSRLPSAQASGSCCIPIRQYREDVRTNANTYAGSYSEALKIPAKKSGLKLSEKLVVRRCASGAYSVVSEAGAPPSLTSRRPKKYVKYVFDKTIAPSSLHT